MSDKKKKKELLHGKKVVENIGEYGKSVSRGQSAGGTFNKNSRGSGRPAQPPSNNTARAKTLPSTRTRLRRVDEIEGTSGKVLHGAVNAKFVGDTIGSGENFAEEYKRYKRGEFFSKPKPKVFKI